jgi:hypothetical protein
MSARERHLRLMVRRELLLIAAAIERGQEPTPLWAEVRRGLLLIAAAIEEAAEFR